MVVVDCCCTVLIKIFPLQLQSNCITKCQLFYPADPRNVLEVGILFPFFTTEWLLLDI